MKDGFVIKPEQFYTSFKQAATAHEKNLMHYWTCGLTQYTKTIRMVLEDVATLLSLNLYNSDYYTLDAVFYREKDIEHFKKGETYVKSITVAFEHENEINDSVCEMNKLQLFNAPLKVLVTYGNDIQRKKILNKFAKIVKDADIFSDFSMQRKQLVIFGDKLGETIEWHPVVYGEGEWVLIA